MLNIAADHIAAVEAKDAAERLAKQQQTDRVTLIGLLQRTIADAERRKIGANLRQRGRRDIVPRNDEQRRALGR